MAAGIYVYGILPADVQVKSGASGVGDPPGKIRLVRSRDLAALVSDVDASKPLGRPEELRAHAELLDATAAEVPVLPLRFGAVLSSEDAVAQELLDEHADEFADALRQLEGHAQYVIKGRYDERAILGEVLSEDPEAERLSGEMKGTDPDASREERIQLGEILNNAVSVKRDHDTSVVCDALDDIVSSNFVRPPSHELDAVHVAVLVESGKVRDMQRAVAKLRRDWDGRVELDVLGPMAAYDFVGTS